MNNTAWVVLVDARKSLVLQRSRQVDDANLWCFPGGDPYVDETPLAAARRNVISQTGLDINKLQLLKILPADNGKVCWFYTTSLDQYPVALNYESRAFQWASLDDLESLDLHWCTKLYVDDLVKQQRLQFRTQLINSSLFLEVMGLLDNQVVASAKICLPTRKLHDVTVNSEYRGRGFAKQLMTYVMHLPQYPTSLTAKAGRNSSLTTANLINFYKTYNFAVVSHGYNEVKMILQDK